MCDSSADTTALETVHFLSGSQHRFEILAAFVEHETLTRQAVRETVTASRSTVRRTLEAFVQRGLLRSVESGYRLTATGEVLADGMAEALELARLTEAYEPLLGRLNTAVNGLDPRWLDGASMTEATETSPYEPAQRQTETVQTAQRFRGFLPAIEIDGARIVHDRIASGQLRAEIVVPSSMKATLTSPPFASLFREQLSTDRFDCYVADDVPFYLGLADDRTVEIGVADEAGIPRALVQSTGAELRTWGEETYESSRADAVALTESDL